MQSFWMRQSCLLAVVLAAGGGGAVLEVQGAPVSAAPMASRAITAFDFFSGAMGAISENGDGTASTSVGTFIGPTAFLGVAISDNADYAISANMQPGQSGQGTGAGTGHLTMEDVFAFDFVTGTFVGPYDVSVDIVVADTTNVGAMISHGVTAQFNPFTGETSVVRRHVRGNQAWGDTAGSLSILVDDGVVFDLEATGVFGQVTLNHTHDVEQIH